MPVAAGTRITWSDLPVQVRAAVEAVLGDPVVAHESGLVSYFSDAVVTPNGW